MKAIIFSRVSSKDQEEGSSIPSQVRRLTEYALKKNLTVENTFQITESSSKETRKQFNEIINFIKKSKEKFALITDTVDRLQRSFRETPLLDDLRKQGKIELHFLRENLIVNENSNSAQIIQWNMGVLFASSYVLQLSDNVKRSQEQCIRDKRWVFSKACFGYRNVTLPSGEKHIEPNPEQAPYVVKVFEEYAKGNNSYRIIAEKMRCIGFPKTSRGKQVSTRTIELILKNSFYYGEMKIKGIRYQHKYTPLISRELFDRVQKIIKNHHKAPVQYAGKQLLFRGIVTCHNCGGSATGDIKKEKYKYYACHNSKRTCVKKWIREEALLKEVLTHFDNIQLTDEQIQDIVKHIKEYEKVEQHTVKNTLQLLNNRLNKTQERISRLIDIHVDGKIDAESYHFKLKEYKDEQQQIMSEIKLYDNNQQDNAITAEYILKLVQNIKETFISSNFDKKQQILRCFISNFTLEREKLHLELKMPFNVMSKSQDRHTWRG
ncbi:MAG: hypothetical protein CL947_02415 [Epsilonproteobacteria bacterium]|nr:hypothetical protein [Campylobacterota bacterium]|tara:strand:+ start:1997 stop:3469 length:1473 start_codon:yes stop_codon:yes gene_type:complete